MAFRSFSAYSALVKAAALAGSLVGGTISAMTLVVGSTDLEPGHVTAVADASGRLVSSGTGFVAVGAFGDLDDALIRDAAAGGAAMQEVLGRFQQLGAASRFGLGAGLERIDGAFQAAVSAPTRAGDGLVGRPVYVVGGTESGLFIYRSQLTFEADAPVAWGQVDLWGDREALADGLLVGEVGESLEVLELGPSEMSLRLASAAGQALDLSRFESTMIVPVEPPAEPLVQPPPVPLVLEPWSELGPGVEAVPSLPDVPGSVPPGGREGSLPWGELVWLDPGMAPWVPIVDGGWMVGGDGEEIFLTSLVLEYDAAWTGTHTTMALNRGEFATTSLGAGFGFSDFTPVPEPGSFLLACAGALVLTTRRRRGPAVR